MDHFPGVGVALELAKNRNGLQRNLVTWVANHASGEGKTFLLITTVGETRLERKSFPYGSILKRL